MKRLRYTKVNVIGAQNTGKTTLINALAEDKDIKASGLNIMTGMLRRMASEGKINISVDGDPDSQRLMFSYYSELLERGNNFISVTIGMGTCLLYYRTAVRKLFLRNGRKC